MAPFLLWTRRLAIATAVLLLMAWMWAWGAQWVLRWRAEQLLADISTLEVGQSTGANVQQFARSRPEWNRSRCERDECFYYSAHLEVFSPYLTAGRMVSFFFPGDYDHQVKFDAVMGHLGLRPMFVDGYLKMEYGSLSMREFLIALPISNSPHAVRSREVSHLEVNPADPREGHHSVVHGLHGFVRGIGVEYEPTEDRTTKAMLMDFQLSCITRFFPCVSDADVLPAARQMIIDENKRTAGVR